MPKRPQDTVYTPLPIVNLIVRDILVFCCKRGDRNEYPVKSLTIVDFAAGDNRFLREVKTQIPSCHTLSFDTEPKSKDVCKKDWFSVKSLPNDCIIGFNPPFGYHGSLARRFLEHAASFRPRFLLSIVPQFHGRWHGPKGYVLLKRQTLSSTYETLYGDPVKVYVPTFYVLFGRADLVSSLSTSTKKHKFPLRRLARLDLFLRDHRHKISRNGRILYRQTGE